MENSSTSAAHFDSSIKSVKGSTQKAEKEDDLELSSREGLRQTGIINGRSEFVKGVGG
jgi:hypothetical protein